MSGSYIGHADADRVQIDDNSVTTGSIANNAVTGIKISMGSDAQGDVLYYNGTDYARLGVGTSGQFLKTQGAGANPVWGTVSSDPSMGGDLSGTASNATIVADAVTYAKMQNLATANRVLGSASTGLIGEVQIATDMIADNAVDGAKIAMGSDAQGDILFYGGTDYERLAPGTSGYFLKTQGASSDPVWATVPAGSPTGGGSEKVFYENENSVDTSYTLTTDFNAVTAGPVTVAVGVTITVPAGQAWVIV